MTHKMSWTMSLVVMTGTAILVTSLSGASPPPGAPATAAALPVSAPAAAAPPTGSPDATAEKERRHYDRLDALARAGGGEGPADRLRKNIDAFRASNHAGAATLDIAALDCSEAVCRVEFRPPANGLQHSPTETARALMPGMGRLAMRPPGTSGGTPVFYLAPARKQLPRLEP